MKRAGILMNTESMKRAGILMTRELMKRASVLLNTGLVMRAIIVLILIAGCTHGQTLEEFAPAQQPQGLQAIVDVTGDEPELRGELLAVRDDGIVILDLGRRIVFIAYDRIADSRFPDSPRLRIGARRAPGPDKQRELRLLSRYPQGLEGDVLARVLDAYGQESLVELR